MKILILILVVGIFSCKAYPPTMLKTDRHVRCTLAKVTKNMKGYKHLFITDSGDSLVRVYERRLVVGSCYFLDGTVKSIY